MRWAGGLSLLRGEVRANNHGIMAQHADILVRSLVARASSGEFFGVLEASVRYWLYVPLNKK